VVYLILLLFFLAVFPSIKKVFTRMRVPVPSLLIALCALLAKMSNTLLYRIVYGCHDTKDSLHIGEGFESLLEACLFFFAVECLVKEIRNRHSGATSS